MIRHVRRRPCAEVSGAEVSGACAVGTLVAMAPSERTRRAAGLDGLRALAALSVLCFHAWLYGFDNPSAVTRATCSTG